MPRSSRKVLYRGGGRGDQVKAVVDTARGYTIVYYRDAAGVPHEKAFPADAQGRRAGRAWAEAYHAERTRLEAARRETAAQGAPALTHRELWEHYTHAPAYLDRRPATRIAYAGRWKKWQRFRGAGTPVNDTTLLHADEFITAARKAEMAINQIRQVLNVARVVMNWGQTRKLVQTNELALFRWQRPNGAVVLAPEEYTEAEYVALLRQLSPQDAGTWRAWVALMLAGHHGQRANAVLHLRWEDIDAEAGVIHWPECYQKNGEPLTQPLTWEAVSALRTARDWLAAPTGRAWTRMNHAQRSRAATIAASPWVLPPHGIERAERGEPYSYQAMWRALRKAEEAAGVEHKPYRALHGFRRMVAGDVADRTGDARLGMEWIGDRDMKQANSYLKQRRERMERAAGVVHRTPEEAANTA
ncbi:MAG TPA: tyrosine-type recombinase/integrase [Gemmatimonadaceae bacterium]|nr:tyrosine-type recombinase/integrase [Gemmatimonadaceae bacterium]